MSSLLEKELIKRFGKEHVILTGRATSALYLCFSNLPMKSGYIIFPAILCPSPAYAAIYAGYKPLFCDVTYPDGNLNPTTLEKLIKGKEDEIAAVLVAHLYGQAAQIDKIIKITTAFNIPLIEDAAQSMGGQYKDQPLGGYGDISVLSFGHTKILDAGYGGAILTNNIVLANQLRVEEKRLRSKPVEYDKYANKYRADYYKLKELSECNNMFSHLSTEYKDLFLFKYDSSHDGKLLNLLKNLEHEVEERNRKALIYYNELKDKNILLQEPLKGNVCWRFNIFVPPDKQKAMTEQLRNIGLNASNWYPALPKYFAIEYEDEVTFLNADRHEKSIINLWVDNEISESDIAKTCKYIKDFG
jgi:dTDP-4-amino-4,6-dideoxygalactose transaminase